jgi:hypothetical protein
MLLGRLVLSELISYENCYPVFFVVNRYINSSDQ